MILRPLEIVKPKCMKFIQGDWYGHSFHKSINLYSKRNQSLPVMSVHLSYLSSTYNIFYLHSSSHENLVYSSFDLREVWSAVWVFFPAGFHQISKLIQLLDDIQHGGAENRNLDFSDSAYDFLKKNETNNFYWPGICS